MFELRPNTLPHQTNSFPLQHNSENLPWPTQTLKVAKEDAVDKGFSWTLTKTSAKYHVKVIEFDPNRVVEWLP